MVRTRAISSAPIVIGQLGIWARTGYKCASTFHACYSWSAYSRCISNRLPMALTREASDLDRQRKRTRPQFWVWMGALLAAEAYLSLSWRLRKWPGLTCRYLWRLFIENFPLVAFLKQVGALFLLRPSTLSWTGNRARQTALGCSVGKSIGLRRPRGGILWVHGPT